MKGDKRHRIRKVPGDLTQPRKKLWQAIISVEAVLLRDLNKINDNNKDAILHASGKMGYLIDKWTKVTIISSLEERVAKLEESLKKEK